MKIFFQIKYLGGLATVAMVMVVGCKPRIDGSRTLDAAGGGGETSEAWVDGQDADWKAEVARRDRAIYNFIETKDSSAAQRYGFSNNQTPAIAWNWFETKPVGLGGVPFVLFKTIALLQDNPAYYTKMAQEAGDVAKGASWKTAFTSYFGTPLPKFTNDEINALMAVAKIWNAPSTVDGAKNLDHIGLLPHPDNYSKSDDPYSPTYGAVNDPGLHKQSLPYGMVFESSPEGLPAKGANKAALLKGLSGKVSGFLQIKTKLGANKVWEKLGYNESSDDKPDTFGKPGKYDNVFFSCAGCHVGRVVTDKGIRFMYGSPNTEIEAQYYSQILRDTAALLVVKGFDVNSKASQVPENGQKPEPNVTAVVALAKAMVMTVMVAPQKFYGKGDQNELRTLHQATQLMDNFGGAIGDLIGAGIKTHFIYNFIAGNKGFKGSDSPDLLANRAGQMDAFGVASGLVGIHSFRSSFKDGDKTLAPSYLEFMYRMNPESPFFTGFEGIADPKTIGTMTAQNLRRNNGENDANYFKRVGKLIRDNIPAWTPPVPAPIDIKNLNLTRDRVYANWDGNQGASARTLASGASATGDPRKVNVRIHEPLNPLINNLPAAPYPFEVDLAKAKEGKKLFTENCVSCHKPKNADIYTAKTLGGVDNNRTLVNTEVSRHGLATMTVEACWYYMRNGSDSVGSNGAPGTKRDWCLPTALQGKWGSDSKEIDKIRAMTKEQYTAFIGDYFIDTPKRIADNEAGFKADMLYGTWSNAPYLHNGSVPTLAHLICDNIRPAKFIRGNINYDKDLVGFVWDQKPKRYSKYDMTNFKTFDTSKSGWHNGGHTFGKQFCGDVKSLGPDATQDQIAAAVKSSPELSGLLEYLKTL